MMQRSTKLFDHAADRSEDVMRKRFYFNGAGTESGWHLPPRLLCQLGVSVRSASRIMSTRTLHLRLALHKERGPAARSGLAADGRERQGIPEMAWRGKLDDEDCSFDPWITCANISLKRESVNSPTIVIGLVN